MCKAVPSPSPNHNKMSVTNDEVNGTQNITGVGGTASIPVTTTSSPPLTMGSSTPNTATAAANDDVVKSGYLRKLKGKKKFFVLRQETDTDKPARLEYYANEKKFRLGHPPKKSIVLKACFNICGPEANLKSKYSVSLHTHNDCVRISMSNEEEMNDWLRVMKTLAGEEEEDETVEWKPHFEHIWMVHALNKGLGSKENIIGPYRLCLTSRELTLLKVGEHDGRNGIVRFPLNVIRNVSHDATFGCFFHIELGRLACTGPGALSLKTDDNNITQNMHRIILNAMQNYSKDDIIPQRERARTYTWNSDGSMRPLLHNTPPGHSSSISIDEPRIRTDSIQSGRIGMSQMSPPVPILTSPLSPPSILFNSPNMYSTGTDSASSSYSIDYDNNNHSLGGSIIQGDKSNDDEEEYVPYYPGEDQHLGNMKLALNPDTSDYVDTGKDSSSNAHTPSPMSPYDYFPMSPSTAGMSAVTSNNGLVKSSGKASVSHSRNSSLIEDTDGYVPMIPGGGTHSRSESGAGSNAGSATGLDEAYLDMDFTRKMNLSNDDMRRASPASSESLQSNTPSSDFPLEKVTSYLISDDFEDSMRPIRAYSLGSKSDTSALSKLRSGKNRLEAVQETIRTRAMSVGSKNPRKPPIHSNTSTNLGTLSSSNKSVGVGPLSSSWSGSTGRWPLSKYGTNHQYTFSNQSQHYPTTYSQATSESADSDLMELDFSKNKKIRKRSQPGPNASLNSTPSSTGSNIQKLSPIPKGVLAEKSGSPEMLRSITTQQTNSVTAVTTTSETHTNRNYISSAPISIIGTNHVQAESFTQQNDTSSQSILTRLTGTDLKKLKELDDEGAYLNMDFSKKPTSSSKNNVPNSTTTPNESNNTTAVKLNLSPSSTPNKPIEPIPSNLSNGLSSSSSFQSPSVTKGSDLLLVTPSPASGLTRIFEESPEKQEQSTASSPQIQSLPKIAPLAKHEDDPQLTYASLEHLPITGTTASSRPNVIPYGLGSSEVGTSCGTASSSSNKVKSITYAQIDFVNAESVNSK